MMRLSLGHRLAIVGERLLDRAFKRLERTGGRPPPMRIEPFAGYRSASVLHVRCRVLRARPLPAADARLAGPRTMLALYNSRELAGVRIRLEAAGRHHETDSDEEGYAVFDLPIDTPLPAATRWEEASLSAPGREAEAASVAVPVLAPGTDGKWGVISDIDDTVIETGATDFLRNWRRLLVERPAQRIAVPGAAPLYRAIALDHRAPSRPFFYVSSSPWNLYGFLTEFMALNEVPHGPMFLKDYGISRERLVGGAHDVHKLAAIETILATYGDFRFLLVGDNGQHDVSIYARAVRDFGSRIAAVFIRDVDGSCREGPEGALIAEIEAAGVPTFCGADFGDALAVVERLGLVAPTEAARAVSAPAA